MKIQERMSQIEVKSYKDCPWYLGNGKCKLPINCPCKEGEEMHEVCIWITQFLKAKVDGFDYAAAENQHINDQWEDYNELILDEETNEVMRVSNPFVKRLSKIFKNLI